MKKIGITGGTFNPVHNAHLIMARYAKEQYGLDSVIFMTSGNPPHKRNIDMPDAEVRHDMLKAAISGDADFTANDYEVKQKSYSYSVNTLRYFKEIYPSDMIYFIIGEDSLADFPKWYMPQEILKLCTVLVYPRGEGQDVQQKIDEIKAMYGGEIYPINSPVIGISSTEIRGRLKSGKTVRHMIPDKVLEYIEKNKLYTKDGRI